MTPEIIYLAATGARVTSEAAEIGGKRFPLEAIERSWVEARRPGVGEGAVMMLLGAYVLARGAVFFKAAGLILMALAFLRLRAQVHVVRIKLSSGASIDALRTGDAALAGRVMLAIERAAGRAG